MNKNAAEIKDEKYPDTFKTPLPSPNELIQQQHTQNDFEQGWIRQGITLYEKCGEHKMCVFGVVIGGTERKGEKC